MVSLANRVLIWFKSAYCRITLTKTTLVFFLFTFAHCFIQSLVQSFLFQLDSDACSLTSEIVSAAKVPENVFAWLSESHNDTTDSNRYTLKLCDQIPFEKSEEENPCVVIFDSDDLSVNEVPNGFRRRDASSSDKRDVDVSSLNRTSEEFPTSLTQAFIQPVFDESSNISAVELAIPGINDGQMVSLNVQCTRMLLYADQVLTNSKREVFALIGSEFWLLSTSTIALMYGSIAHLYAALAFRVLSVGWSAYSIWRTHDIDRRFDVLLTSGACEVDLFPGYVKPRIAIQSVDLSLNVLALILMAYLCSRLVRTYTTVMFRCIGPPDHVVRIHKYVLGLFTCLQVSVYLLVTSAALWLDQLRNGAIASISSHMSLYLSIFIVTLVLLIPWIWIGWRSVRFEQRRLLYVFVGLGLLFEVGWSGMYDSLVWRWTWIEWPFFASTAVASQAILIASVVFGIICRLNFGKGLKQYLQAASALEKEDFEPEIFESSNRNCAAPNQNDDDGWAADIEKRIMAERLSQALDFGAHQPAPPPSPPSWSIPAAPPKAAAATVPQSTWTSAEQTARPTSFTSVLPTLPTLDKFSPWSKPDQHDEKGGDPMFRF
ncbi:hypothetical protein ACEPAH_3886 [Sanghuangporus vaninii]